jgi:hypothetical protein
MAIQNFWNAGPATAPTYGMGAYPFVPAQNAQIYWQQIGAYTWQLTGAGASLGPRGW